MADGDFATITLRASGKKVSVPRDMFKRGDALAIRQFAFQSGQATSEEAGISQEFKPSVVGDASLIGAGRMIDRLGSNFRQLGAEIGGDSATVQKEKDKQAEIERLSRPAREAFPKSSFLGEAIPGFAIPGGKIPQVVAGVTEGALQGDTPLSRIGLGALGGGLSLIGAKVGDKIGGAVQNRLQRAIGDPDAGARQALQSAGVPLTLSQRQSRDSVLGGSFSRPITRFFERAQFALTGRQPLQGKQQQALTGLITEALGIGQQPRLTREVLGRAVTDNTAVFSNAANRAAKASRTGRIELDDSFKQAINEADKEFRRVGSDSSQVTKIFNQISDLATGRVNVRNIDPDIFLKMRSNLSAATTKSDLETTSLIQAIDAMDSLLGRIEPSLSADLKLARERFRLLLAVRRGSALSPSGEINIPSFTKNLERVFNNFDVGSPLPGSLRETGEAVAGFNQVFEPFRSSGTAENAAALAGPAAATDPTILARLLAGPALALSGGGAGSLIGGASARGLLNLTPSIRDADGNIIGLPKNPLENLF